MTEREPTSAVTEKRGFARLSEKLRESLARSRGKLNAQLLAVLFTASSTCTRGDSEAKGPEVYTFPPDPDDPRAGDQGIYSEAVARLQRDYY